MNLFEMTTATRQLYELMEAGEIDEQTFNDTVAAIGAEEKLESYVQVLRSLSADIDAHAKEKERHIKAMAQLTKNMERLESSIKAFMVASGQTKANAGTFKLSLRPSKSTMIDDASLIPAKFMKQPEAPPAKPDKAAIKAAIEAGESVQGAHIEVNQSLMVR